MCRSTPYGEPRGSTEEERRAEEDAMYSHLTPAVAAERWSDDVRQAAHTSRHRRRRRHLAAPSETPEVEISTCREPRVRWRDAAAPGAERPAGA